MVHQLILILVHLVKKYILYAAFLGLFCSNAMQAQEEVKKKNTRTQ
jgi:hypothetical protein